MMGLRSRPAARDHPPGKGGVNSEEVVVCFLQDADAGGCLRQGLAAKGKNRKVTACCCGETAVTDLSLKVGQVGGSSAGGVVAVLRVTLHLLCKVTGSVKLQPSRAGCPRASGSQRQPMQPCGGCAQHSGIGTSTYTQS